jgi:hypothetical protein
MDIIDATRQLWKSITEKVILFLAIFGLAKLGVVQLVVPNFANFVYSTIDFVIQLVVYTILTGLLIATVASIVNFVIIAVRWVKLRLERGDANGY